jgi:hypothetical protein
MSPQAIAARFEEFEQLFELALSLRKAKPQERFSNVTPMRSGAGGMGR